MKKMSMILAIAMLLMMVIGMVGISSADNDCTGPASVACNTHDSNGNHTGSCALFVSAGTPADGCYNAP